MKQFDIPEQIDDSFIIQFFSLIFIEKQSYEKAINIWTVKDVLKREIAKLNNLNYLEIFSIDLQKAIDIFENYINKS